MLFEIRAIEPFPPAASLGGFHVDGPRPGDRLDADGFEVDGWVLGRDRAVAAVEVVTEHGVRCRVPVERDRPDVGSAFPTFSWASRSGFRGWVPTAGLPPSAALDVRAVLADGARVPLAAISAARVADRPVEPEPDADGVPWQGPDFIIIGAQRSGSTSLYHYLTQHPLVAPAAEKELKYFTLFHGRPWGWYRRRFPAALPTGGRTGEATPYYLFHPHAPRRIKERATAARLIAVLRNPVDRAYSHYVHERRRGIETLSFEDALATEAERLAGEVERMQADETYASLAHHHFSYQARGCYADQLRRWFALFARDRLLVLRSEDLYADPAATLNRVTAFLGLPSAVLSEARPHNEGTYPPMRSETRRRLEGVFDRANDELRAMLGEDFGWDG